MYIAYIESAAVLPLTYADKKNRKIALEANYSKANERTICKGSTDCLLNQIRFICCCHTAKVTKTFC